MKIFIDLKLVFKHHIYMFIKNISETSYSGMFKIAPEEGSAFFVRKEYLPEGLFELLDVGAEFSEDQADCLMDAGLSCAVELKAVGYLARAEQSRFGLTRKLIEKKYEKKYVEAALDYLEMKGYLSDLRFATAWLNTRRTNHYEDQFLQLRRPQGPGLVRGLSELLHLPRRYGHTQPARQLRLRLHGERTE